MDPVFIFLITLPVIVVGGCCLWSALLKKTKLGSDSKLMEISSGLFLGVITVLVAFIADLVNDTCSETMIIGGEGIAVICSGLFFGGNAGLISAVIGTLFELLSHFINENSYALFSDSVTTFLAGISVLLVQRYLLRGRRPSVTICLLSALEVTALSVVIYPITSFAVTEHLGALLWKVCLSICIANILTVLGTLLGVRKNDTGHIRREHPLSSGLYNFRSLPGFFAIAVFLSTAVIFYLCITAVSTYNAVVQLTTSLDSAEGFLTDNPDAWAEDIEKCLNNDIQKIFVADNHGELLFPEGGEDPSQENSGIHLSGSDVENELYTSRFDGKTYFCMSRKSGEYNLTAAVDQSVSFAFRAPILLVFISIEILIMYAVVILMSIMMEKELIARGEEVNDALESLIGKNPDRKSDNEFYLFGENMTGYMRNTVQRIAGEMRFAGDIQLQSLPSCGAAMDGVAIRASVKAARDVGGDFYDYFMLDGNRIVFLVADVSGKGISAALIMMRAKATIREVISQNNGNLMKNINNALCRGNGDNMFVTAWIGILDTSTGVVQYFNIAQGNKIRRSPEEDYQLLDNDPQPAMGIREDIKYTCQSLQMVPGSRLLLYTDGATDVTNASGEMYGEERMLTFLNENCRTSNGATTIADFEEELSAFMGREEQFDDITLMTVDYFGQWENFSYLTKEFSANDKELDAVIEFVNGATEILGCSESQIMEMNVALEEIFVNISHYGYDNKDGNVKIEVSTDFDMATIRFTDWGTMFNPLNRFGPDNSIPVRDRKEGGLGITMVRACVNYVDYKYDDGKNIFTMIKIIR